MRCGGVLLVAQSGTMAHVLESAALMGMRHSRRFGVRHARSVGTARRAQAGVGFPPQVGGLPPWLRPRRPGTVGGVLLASRRPSLIAGLLSAVAVAAIPSAASAAQRYASPAGAGAGCTSDKPCSLTSAIKIAGLDDELILSPGDYPLTQTVEDPARITIRGVAAQPRPRLLFSGANQQGLRLMNGSLLRDVEIEQAEAADTLTTSGARVDRVVLKGSASTSCAIILRDAIVRDSVVVSGLNPICSSPDGPTNTSSLRNVTVIATQPASPAVNLYGSGDVTFNLTNVIAQGGPGGPSLYVASDGLGGHGTISATHSNFATVQKQGFDIQFVDGGGNQHVAPTFVNAAAGDYRQAAGSVTIDSGLNEPLNGAFDVDGELRRIATTDIGAHEFVPVPMVVTGPATGVSAQAATLIGSVTANGVPTSYHFEYGPTTAYGSATPATDPGTGLGALPVTAALDGLSPGMTYHYRLVASNKAGVNRGYDQSLTTSSTAPGPSTSSPTPAFAGVRLVSTRLTLSGKFITLKLSCPAATVGGCSGRTRLAAKRLTLGKARFSIAAGDRAKVRVRVTRAGLRRLGGVRRLRGRDVSAAHDGSGASRTSVTRVTIRHRTVTRSAS